MTGCEWLTEANPTRLWSCMERSVMRASWSDCLLSFAASPDRSPGFFEPRIRKLRLGAAGCCRNVAHLLPGQPWLAVVDLLEGWANGEAAPDDAAEAKEELGAGRLLSEEYVERMTRARHPSPGLSELHATYHAMATILEIRPSWGGEDYYAMARHAALAAAFAGGAKVPRRRERPQVWRHSPRPFESSFGWRAAIYRDPRFVGASATLSRQLRDVFGNPFRPVAFAPAWRTQDALLLARQMYDSRDFGAMPILADALQDAGCEDASILDHCRDPGPHVRGCWVVDLVLGKA